jgi:hypothetical protein
VWDPALTVSPDGVLYAAYMTGNGTHNYPTVAVSFDNGATFPVVTRLAPTQVGNWGDRPFLAAGPHGVVYLSWDYGPSAAEIQTICPPFGSCSFSNGDLNMVVQASTDYGRSWSPMVHVSPGFPASGADLGPMVVEPDGQIDMAYQDMPTNKKTLALGPGHLYFTSSTDGGKNWSAPVRFGPAAYQVPLSSWWIDGDIAIDAGGNLYVTWDSNTGRDDIGWLSYSTNHGHTWSAPLRVTPDNDNAVHIVQVAGGASGEAEIGWETNSSPRGYALYLRPFSISHGWLESPVRASANLYGNSRIWPGDTFGLSSLAPAGADCVAASWGSATAPLAQNRDDIFATTIGIADQLSPDCPSLPGYNLESSIGGIHRFHHTTYGPPDGTVPDAVGLASKSGGGYWVVGRDGGVFAYGVPYYGSLPGRHVHVDDIVGAAATADGRGYWLAGANGAVYAFGDANDLGSPAGTTGVTGIAAAASGMGYWVVTATGGVFAYGSARFHGSCGALHSGCHGVRDVAGIDSPDTGGYWLVERDGGVLSFGDARFAGACPSAGSGCRGVDDVVGMAHPDSGGYWLATSSGGVFAFGDAQSFGGVAAGGVHIVGIST